MVTSQKKPAVVILCGGKGMRLREETEYRPKPLVEIGDKPILWHIMKIYAHYGFNKFILCLGYKGDMIRNYFANYLLRSNDVTINLKTGKTIYHENPDNDDWLVTLVQTGFEANTGSRVKKIEKYINTDDFLLTYGDGVADIDVTKVFELHKSHGKIGTVVATHPTHYRWGEITIGPNSTISEFKEKPQIKKGFINGGFFCFKKKFFKYLSEEDDCVLEHAPLQKLVKIGELVAWRHKGFWFGMDTYRDYLLLNDMWRKNPKWKVWK